MAACFHQVSSRNPSTHDKLAAVLSGRGCMYCCWPYSTMIGGRAPCPRTYCFNSGSHFCIVFSTQPSTAFVTMQTIPRDCATLMTWIAALWSCWMWSRMCGRSGRGWPNHAGIWSCQSTTTSEVQESAPTAQSHWSDMWSFRMWRIQLVGQSVSSQSKNISVRRFGKAPGRGRSMLLGVGAGLPASALQSTAGRFRLGAIRFSPMPLGPSAERRQTCGMVTFMPRRLPRVRRVDSCSSPPVSWAAFDSSSSDCVCRPRAAVTSATGCGPS
mmetsp:Transcript_87543/g.261113  ORF Transcript_87543/g.261113 Transcript_87543/m.261113 type:complete len:270 (+) Transcript_87543:668-1477(+)